MSVHLNVDEGVLTIPDLGVTLRTLLAVASNGYSLSGRRTWKIDYKSVVIGSVRVKTERKT